MANTWSVVMMAIVRFLVENKVDKVDNATLQGLAASDKFKSLCFNPDKISANVGASFYDETPFSSFPTLFQQLSRTTWKPLPEAEWIFRSGSRGNGSAKPNAAIMALLEPKPETPSTVESASE